MELDDDDALDDESDELADVVEADCDVLADFFSPDDARESVR